ncbi:MAG: hypothetical protein WC307_00645 [Candidatus Nanoarchaeia archaeon]
MSIIKKLVKQYKKVIDENKLSPLQKQAFENLDKFKDDTLALEVFRIFYRLSKTETRNEIKGFLNGKELKSKKKDISSSLMIGGGILTLFLPVVAATMISTSTTLMIRRDYNKELYRKVCGIIDEEDKKKKLNEDAWILGWMIDMRNKNESAEDIKNISEFVDEYRKTKDFESIKESLENGKENMELLKMLFELKKLNNNNYEKQLANFTESLNKKSKKIFSKTLQKFK